MKLIDTVSTALVNGGMVMALPGEKSAPLDEKLTPPTTVPCCL